MEEMPSWLQQNFQRLAVAYQTKKLPHALLLIGEPGDGAYEFCQALTALLMCERNGSTACGACKSCLLMKGKNHPDFMHVVPEGKSETIKVDVIRQLTSLFMSTAQLSANKVVWLQNVETMNANAANALLKLLEEPTANSYLILHTATLGRLLPTIRSRCQIHRLQKPNVKEAHAYVSQQCNDDHLDVKLDMVNGQPYRAMSVEKTELDAWFEREQQFIHLTDFTTLAKEINKSELPILLRQVLLWIDHAVRVKMNTQNQAPAISQTMQHLLADVQMVSLFQFRDYIISMIKAMDNRANLNVQLVSEQLSARWQNLRRST